MRLAIIAIALAGCQSSDVSRELGARCDSSSECDDRCLTPSADWPEGFCTIRCETDVDCFRNARLTVVDTLHAFEEAGELRQAAAANALPEAKRATLGQIVTGSLPVPGEGMIVFKSVGSALQDLALASRYYEKLGAKREFPRGAGVGELRRRPWARPAS